MTTLCQVLHMGKQTFFILLLAIVGHLKGMFFLNFGVMFACI